MSVLAMDAGSVLQELLFEKLLVIGLVFVGVLVVVLALAFVLRRPRR